MLAQGVNCSKERLNLAIESSKNSLNKWRSLLPIERGRLIYRIARNVQKNLQMLVTCEAINSGRSSREVKDLDVASVIKSLYYYAGSVGLEDSQLEFESLGLVTICNYYDNSLLSLVSKLAPALVAGNVVIVLPHHLNPLSTFMFADICQESGIPPGVINIVLSGKIFHLTILDKIKFSTDKHFHNTAILHSYTFGLNCVWCNFF
jgi:aldehyde dehydrogenase (NAD+)